MKIIKWKVIKWEGKWKAIWFPTLNIQVLKTSIAFWVYKVNIIINWELYKWAWCLLEKKNVFETHVLDFDQDIYWQEVEIIIIKKIRDNIRFENINKLSNQIQKDISIISNTEIIVLTFWTFDLFHKWHQFYLQQAKKYWDKLITIIGRDLTVAKLKWSKPRQNEYDRLKQVKKSWIPDKIYLWDKVNFLNCLSKLKADIVCLGYDQKSHLQFNLEKYLKENKLKIEIIVIKWYKPEIYKSSKL